MGILCYCSIMEQFKNIDSNIIRILAVAPYQGLKESLEREARSFPQVQLDAVTGDLEEGVRLTEENFHANYDILISRGGTARLLRDRVELPVVEVPITLQDFLQAIRLSDGLGKRAVVGFPNITDTARELIDLLHLDIQVFTLSTASDIYDILAQLRQLNYRGVICDVVSSNAARAAGFDTILITSGQDSIRRALSDAVQEVYSRRALRNENLFLRQVLTEHSGETAVFLENGTLYFSTAEDIQPELLRILDEYRQDVLDGSLHRFTRSLDGYLYTIKASLIKVQEKTYIAYYYTRNRAGGVARTTGITSYTRREVREILENSFFRLSGEMNSIQNTLKQIADSSSPLLIMGEYGTGRTEAAMEFALHCHTKNQAYIEVDMQILTDRSRDFLLNNQRSPLFFSGNIIHLKNLGFLPVDYTPELFTTMIISDVCRNNRVIISGNPGHENLRRYLQFIKDKFICAEVELLPLRATAERIPAMANLYLSQQKAKGRTDVIRIENDALRILSSYQWPGNYTQMERVLNQLLTVSRDHMVHAEDARAVLQMENTTENTHTVSANYLNLHQPLDQIEKAIITAVLQENNGNQSAAAKQLGISRTTLWRMLKD